MPESQPINNDFLEQINEIIETNISNELFGVSELAREVGMSRSNLLRKIKSQTNLSASQYISQLRLKHAMEMLKEKSYTVSEVSYKVGFSSTSYFIKCFREFYGYPPGEVGNHKNAEETIVNHEIKIHQKPNYIVLASSLFIVVSLIALFILKPFTFQPKNLEKSIAVLPFKNDSNDSTNVYIINGLMESVLNDLQKIKDLRVISRTSVEKYRNSDKTISQIAKELNVSYFVEGSGQKIGDKILLHIQLIEGQSDKHLWAEQYAREAKDIFTLQMEVAKNIAGQIEAIITPEEEERINKVPTQNPVAYDYFLKGLDYLNHPDRTKLTEAITFFSRAIAADNKFARAYAATAIAYYFRDEDKNEHLYSDSINYYADKALFYDSELPQSTIAKGLFYMSTDEYQLSITYFEKALEYNPNYDLALAFLVDIYANHIPNTEKYLEYALKGIRLDIAAYDSLTASMIYLHISNAFIQNGFITEAEKYINQSLEFDSGNLYSEYVKAYILYAKYRNLEQTKELLIAALKKDTTRIDILQEVGKICYYMRDYKSAYNYYQPFEEVKKAYDLDIFRSEDAKIARVFAENGRTEEAEKLITRFKEYADFDQSIYKNINLALYYSYRGETQKAIDYLKLFAEQNNYHYWTLIFVPDDPLIDNIKNRSEFKKTFTKIEKHFWENHEQIKKSLIEKGLL